MAKRDTGLDVIKALAMFMVVFLHVRVYAPGTAFHHAPAPIENLCMVSSLSMFLMISGMFSRRLYAELSFPGLLQRVLVCLWPVLTMIAVVGTAVRLAMGMGMLSLHDFMNFVLSAGWFFFCLVLCEVTTFAACFLSRERAWLRAWWMVLAYVAFWALPFGLFHIVEMIPFFWFGIYAFPRLRALRFSWAIGLVALGAFVAASCWLGDFQEVGLVFHDTSMHLLSFTWRGFVLMLGRIVFGILGALGVMLSVSAAVSSFPTLGRLAFFGTQTMGIFFVHILLLGIYAMCGGCYGGGMLARLWMSVALFLVSHFTVLLLRGNRIVNAVVWNPLLAWSAKREGRQAGGGK